MHAVAKQKHFLVSQLIQPAEPTLAPTEVEIEAVYSGQKQIIFWRELQDTSRWRQGWL